MPPRFLPRQNTLVGLKEDLGDNLKLHKAIGAGILPSRTSLADVKWRLWILVTITRGPFDASAVLGRQYVDALSEAVLRCSRALIRTDLSDRTPGERDRLLPHCRDVMAPARFGAATYTSDSCPSHSRDVMAPAVMPLGHAFLV